MTVCLIILTIIQFNNGFLNKIQDNVKLIKKEKIFNYLLCKNYTKSCPGRG